MKHLAIAGFFLVMAASGASAQVNAGEQKPEASLPFNMEQVTTATRSLTPDAEIKSRLVLWPRHCFRSGGGINVPVHRFMQTVAGTPTPRKSRARSSGRLFELSQVPSYRKTRSVHRANIERPGNSAFG